MEFCQAIYQVSLNMFWVAIQCGQGSLCKVWPPEMGAKLDKKEAVLGMDQSE